MTWKITTNDISAAGFKSMLVATAAGDLQVDRLTETGIIDYPYTIILKSLSMKQLFYQKCKNIRELGQNMTSHKDKGNREQ